MSDKKKSSSTAVNLIAGGTAGLFEALCCHPLDTIKVRMQLHRKSGIVKNPGFITTGISIAKKEGVTGLYKGLGAVVMGIIPKMAIRFSSYEFYRGLLKDPNTGVITTGSTFWQVLVLVSLKLVLLLIQWRLLKLDYKLNITQCLIL